MKTEKNIFDLFMIFVIFWVVGYILGFLAKEQSIKNHKPPINYIDLPQIKDVYV